MVERPELSTMHKGIRETKSVWPTVEQEEKKEGEGEKELGKKRKKKKEIEK